MSKQKRARELARARFERQVVRRAMRARRRRRRNTVLWVVVAVVAVVGGAVLIDRTMSDEAGAAAELTPTAEPTTGPVTARCAYSRDGTLAPRVTVPDRAAAPCTVNAFVDLARAGALDGTGCNRLTGAKSAGRFLECGDPAGRAPAASGSSTSFRLPDGDSRLGVGPTVFGTVSGGLDVVQQVAEAGPRSAGGEEPAQGAPALRTVVESVTVEAS